MPKPESAAKMIAVSVAKSLDAALLAADGEFRSTRADYNFKLSAKFKNALKELSDKSEEAGTAFTNIVTCLSIKAANPSINIRFYKAKMRRENNQLPVFSFRPISEKVVYPWLSRRDHNFKGAKSGWQTRVFERQIPYTRDYDEPIEDVKGSFLQVFDSIEDDLESASDALTYLLYEQIVLRESSDIPIVVPSTDDISLIVELLESHFHAKYAGKGASRLPVLAIYATYQAICKELERYKGKTLRELNEHAAADVQTGATGDFEVVHDEVQDALHSVFEAGEIKHLISITEQIIEDAASKIMTRKLDRYYILTTAVSCAPSEVVLLKIRELRSRFQTQIIVNGVLPTIRYYLRLLRNPSVVLENYVALLKRERVITHEHRVKWNEINVKGVRGSAL